MSFRLKTILGIALIESVLLVLLIFSGMKFFSDSNESHLKQRAETTSLLFSKAVKDALISDDLATLVSFTDDILTLPDIIYVRISNMDIVLTEGGDPKILNLLHTPDNSLADVTDGLFDITIEIKEAETQYGKIEIGLSTAPIEKAMSQAQSWAISIAVIEVILVAIFSFILGTYLTRQLHQLKQASKKIAISGPGHQIELKGKDEISEVVEAFNSMSSIMANNYKQLTQSIAAEKRMSATAQQNQAQNNAILTASLDALITINQEGDVVNYNKVAASVFGWTFEEVFGKNLAEFIIPKHKRNAHHAGMKKFLITKDSPVINQRLQLTAQHKLGHSFPIEINIAPIETEKGILFTAFIRDISARLASEQELKLAAQTFDSSEAMFISDAHGDIIRINQAFTEITGYDKQDIIGKNPSLLSSGRHNAEYYKKMWATLTSKGEWSGEIYNKRKNGEIYPEYLNISAVNDASGSITHYIAHFMDITQQKNTEEKLRQARRDADQSNQSKSLFLASMSHEIRTPMNAVLGILDLLTDTELSDKQLSLITTARDSGELLMTIINDILDFTKMDIDTQVLQLSEFDIHLLLNNCIGLLKHLAIKKGLTLCIERSPDLPQFVKGDPDRLQQILINLINNAIKFTEFGSVKLIVKHDIIDNDDTQLMLNFRVCDTGIGIHQDNQAVLFDEFTMVDQTHSRKYEGTGLGLAICRRLITLMNGKINVISELGEGSTFYFSIQLEKADASNVQQTMSQQQTIAPAANTRILLAEDNLANQMVIKSILEFADLKVRVVSNGYEAWQAVQDNDFDIVLMDISMPEMDGMTATKEIRALSGPVANIPIIALTAHTLSGDKERFIAAGMNDFLSKPIDRVATLSCISHWTNAQNTVIDEPVEEIIPAEDSTLLVDEKVLLQLVEDTDAEIVPELIKLYIEDTQQRIVKINNAIDNKDVKSLEFETHTVGSSAVAHGNAKLYKLARKIELMCRENEQQQALIEAKQISDVAEQSFSHLAGRAKQGF